MPASTVCTVVCAFVAAVAPPPSGFVAKTPLDEVKQLDAQLAALLQDGEALAALVATDAELRPIFVKAGVNKRDLDTLIAGAASQRHIDDDDIPRPFAPLVAFVGKHERGSTHEVRFYDENSYRIDIDLFVRGKDQWALSGAPQGQPSNLADDIEWFQAAVAEGRRKDLPRLFSKEPQGWVEAKFPAPDTAYCRDAMHAKAKQIFEQQTAYRAKHNKFRGGERMTSFGDGFLGWSAVEPIDDDHFRAEVGRNGGLVTIDETGAVTDVSPCALTKEAVQAQKKREKQKAKDAKKPKP